MPSSACYVHVHKTKLPVANGFTGYTNKSNNKRKDEADARFAAAAVSLSLALGPRSQVSVVR